MSLIFYLVQRFIYKNLSVQLSGNWQRGRTPAIRGGPLKNIYEFAQLHFHWGARDNTGSEHTIRRQRLDDFSHLYFKSLN